jgi:predicted alpha/beta-hydrolase family hydrolase
VPVVQEIVTAAGPAHVRLEQPQGTKPAFLAVLTHGAGGTPDTADLLAAKDALKALGAITALVTQPYRVRGARAPGNAGKQDAAWVELVTRLRTDPALPLIQGGRSNGARVACRTARAVGAAAVIALAFPLHPPGRPGQSRDAELRAAGASVLVVNGDRDPFGVPGADAATDVVILEGETHALSRHPAAVGDAPAGRISSGSENPPR